MKNRPQGRARPDGRPKTGAGLSPWAVLLVVATLAMLGNTVGLVLDKEAPKSKS